VDSFGIVKVGELPGVKVSVAGQDMGKTDAQGKLFVPTLNSYYDNEVSIAPDTLPIEYEIAATSKKVSPSARGGALIDFAATKLQAFTGVLKYQADGEARPVVYQEVSLNVPGKPLLFQTGKAGEFYLENLKPGTYAASTVVEGKRCAFDIVIPESPQTFVDLPDIVCRPRP
jgi:outer membrane usher protein